MQPHEAEAVLRIPLHALSALDLDVKPVLPKRSRIHPFPA